MDPVKLPPGYLLPDDMTMKDVLRIDAELLARAAMHVSTTAECANNVYNVSNGSTYTWRSIWPGLAADFDLEPGGPASSRFEAFAKPEGSHE